MADPEHRRRILERRALLIGASVASLLGCSADQSPPPQHRLASAAPAESAAALPPPPASAAGGAAGPDAGPAPAAGPRPKLVQIVCLSIRIVERLEFAHGSVMMSPRNRRLLDTVAEVLDDNPQIRVELAGHIDPSERSAGKSLALRRASEARRYLQSRGVADSRLCVRALGDSRPLAQPSTAEGRARNRRVEFRKLADDEDCAP